MPQHVRGPLKMDERDKYQKPCEAVCICTEKYNLNFIEVF